MLSDGSLALLSSVEDDLWEETLEEQMEAQPCDRCAAMLMLGRLFAPGGAGWHVRPHAAT